MKVNPQIDEMLCGFIDGELSLRQQTEVQRMAARDPEVAQRLQQLRNCRTLINILPHAEAPDDMLEQIRLSLERRSLLEERPILAGTRAGARRLMARRVLAAAAMIALVGVLGAVVYQIVAPAPPGRAPEWAKAPEKMAVPVPTPEARPALTAADSGFSGRLELSTASFAQADGFIKQAIEENGLSCIIEPFTADNRTVYRISGDRNKLNGFLTDVESIWSNMRTASLSINTPHFGDQVAIDSVTLPQIARIVNQNTVQARLRVAKDIAVLNRFNREAPGRQMEVAAAQKLDGAAAALSAIPRPRLASQDRKYQTISTPLEGEAKVKVSLTIVLLNAQ